MTRRRLAVNGRTRPGTSCAVVAGAQALRTQGALKREDANIMRSKVLVATLGLLGSGAVSPVAMAQIVTNPQYNQLGAARARGEDPAYHVNRYGYGNYVQGPNGAFGGYPAGSPGAIELQNEQDRKCRFVPETC